MLARSLVVAAAMTATAVAVVGCADKVPGGTTAAATSSIAVTAADSVCAMSSPTATAGPTTFAISNSGSQLTEFYVYDATGTKILTEKPNIGPGISATLVYDFAPGTYTVSCRPNGTGAGVRSTLTVGAARAGAGGSALVGALTKATATYRTYVEREVAALVAATEEFAAVVRAGDLAGAKAQYPTARQHYERIEPIAEAFVDLDYALDVREDGVEPGKPWTGWHAIETILWTQNATRGAESLATQLVADTKKLAAEIPALDINPSVIGNGASALMEEVAQRKVTGEEERYSHTDIWDFVANVEGARAAFQSLQPVVAVADQALAAEITEQFNILEAELTKLKVGRGYPLYTTVPKETIRSLANRVDALSEPLSRLTASVVS